MLVKFNLIDREGKKISIEAEEGTTIKDAIMDLKNAFVNNLFNNPLNNEMYFNIKRMKSLKLK